MIFIFTCSQCETTDIVMREFDENDVLRFNIDKPDDFAWDFHRCGFRIVDKTSGREISNKNFTSFYLRKPIFFNRIDVPWFGCIENWCREETTELYSDFFRECQSRGLVALVRCSNNKFGKFRQLLAAEKHFQVAPWHFFHGELPEELKRGRWVVKSMTSTPIGKDKMFFVKEVDPRDLDLSYPWFVQERVDGEMEVTVVYIDGKILKYRTGNQTENFRCKCTAQLIWRRGLSKVDIHKSNCLAAMRADAGGGARDTRLHG